MMSGILLLEQALNGLQFGLMLFLLASGLTLVFGIMDMIRSCVHPKNSWRLGLGSRGYMHCLVIRILILFIR